MEPAPTEDTRIGIGDVGFIRRGQFHLLFSAGSQLGERQLGDDVPRTFEPLTVGRTTFGQPRLPGCLRTDTVREVGAGLGASVSTGALYVYPYDVLHLTEKCTIQALGTRRTFLFRTHWKPRCGTRDEVPDIQGGLSVGICVRKIYQAPLRVLGHVRS